MKAILYNGQALVAKYRAAFGTQVLPSLQALVTAGTASGLAPRIFDVTDPATAAALGVPVAAPGSELDHKNFVDAVAAMHSPNYIVLIGSQDTFPTQTLVNPLMAVSYTHLTLPTNREV